MLAKDLTRAVSINDTTHGDAQIFLAEEHVTWVNRDLETPESVATNLKQALLVFVDEYIEPADNTGAIMPRCSRGCAEKSLRDELALGILKKWLPVSERMNKSAYDLKEVVSKAYKLADIMEEERCSDRTREEGK